MSPATPHARPLGRALIIGSPPCRVQPLAIMQGLGYECAEADDPYAAMLELCQRPLVYRAVVLSLQSIYREELLLIATLRRRLPHLAVWLAQTDGRHAALAEASRFGVDGLLDQEGLHPMAATAVVEQPAMVADAPLARREPPAPAEEAGEEMEMSPGDAIGEPVLTADELRALLQEQPTMPPAGGGEGE